MTDYFNLISEIAHTKRMNLFFLLNEKPCSLVDLTRHINLSKSEISRHLSRLIEIGIVEKNVNQKKYSLALLGQNLFPFFSPIEFILDHSEYFQNHSIPLPLDLSRQIDCLKKADFVSGIGNVLFKTKDIFETVQNRICIMSDQKFPFDFPPKTQEGLFIIPESLKDDRHLVEHFFERMEGRMLPNVPLSILLTDDKQGVIFFPLKTYDIDFNCCFLVNYQEGLEFLRSIWDYYWSIGKKPLFLSKQ